MNITLVKYVVIPVGIILCLMLIGRVGGLLGRRKASSLKSGSAVVPGAAYGLAVTAKLGNQKSGMSVVEFVLIAVVIEFTIYGSSINYLPDPAPGNAAENLAKLATISTELALQATSVKLHHGDAYSITDYQHDIYMAEVSCKQKRMESNQLPAPIAAACLSADELYKTVY